MSLHPLVLVILAVQLFPLSVQAGETWQFRLTPYLWFAGLKGDVATIAGAPAAPINISPSDAVADTEASLMLLIDAKRGRHGVFADLLYSDVESDDELIPPPINLALRSITRTTIVSLAYQYEVFNREQAIVDVLLGARYWRIDAELRFGSGTGGPLDGRRVDNDESWIDPLVGIKGRIPLGSSKFYIEGGVGLGGFGVGSDLFYEFNGGGGYQWSRTISTTIGYRIFDVDYEDDGFVYDVRQQGWQLGLTWAF
jgi:hypothetical protein